jgi:N-acyl-D-amino-acid deacylase
MVVVANAHVIDGTGAAGYPADLLIRDGVIVAIENAGVIAGPATAPESAELIDAAGLVVCPGFIDVHSHADHAPLLEQDDLAKIRQGVTTEVVGNCGFSLAPIARGTEDAFLTSHRWLFDCDYRGWHSPTELFDELDRHPGVTNLCPLIGHGALRLAVLGHENRPARAEDVAGMGRVLREAIDYGAFGMSSGLLYPPGVYSTVDEMAALASYLPADRVYATHMRDEGDHLLASIEEALTVGRRAGCRVQISHLKAAGRQNWGGVARALERIDDARGSGLAVAQDAYPYAAASTMLRICLPPWVHEGDAHAVLARLRDRTLRATMREQVQSQDGDGWENLVAGAGGYDGLLVCATGSGRFEGRTVAQLADDLALDPFDALIHVLVSEELDASMVVFDMSEHDVETALLSPFTSIGSDGGVAAAGNRQHPRLFGTFPRVLGRYVRERGLLALPEAIRRMTSFPAATFGVPERGTVAVGKIADLVCFDPGTVGHPADFLSPDAEPVGIAWVMQSGHRTLEHGRWAGVRLGSRLAPA